MFPPFTFVSTANAFVLRGARPVFVDIRPDTLNLDERLLEGAITPRTKAIYLVHYAGVACEMDAVAAIAARHGLAIVEDNAHGLFGRYKGRALGSFGVMSTLSFHDTKNLSCGEGGALVLNDASLTERAEIIREKGTNRAKFYRGQLDKYTWVDVGSSFLPSDILAAYLLAQLEAHEAIQRRRQAIWTRYRDGADRLGGARRRARCRSFPRGANIRRISFHLLMPSLAVRTAFIQHMRDHRVLAMFHYQPLHLSDMGRRLRRAAGPVPGDRGRRGPPGAPAVVLPTGRRPADTRHRGRGVVRAMTTAASGPPPSVLIVGAAGQLGERMAAQLAARYPVTPLTRRDVDVTDARALRAAVIDRRPGVVINCAAYNNVDAAEDAAAHAIEVNALAVGTLARAVADVGGVFVHYSSDFVFDGRATTPYTEADAPEPCSVYGQSKLVGEWLAADAPRHYVLRVESLFGGSRARSSIDKIIAAVREGRPGPGLCRSHHVAQLRRRCGVGHRGAGGFGGAGWPLSLRQHRLRGVARCRPRDRAAARPPALVADAGLGERRLAARRASAVCGAQQRQAGARRVRDALLAGCAGALSGRPAVAGSGPSSRGYTVPAGECAI